MDAPRVPSHGGSADKNGVAVRVRVAYLYFRTISTIDPLKLRYLVSLVRAKVIAERPPVAIKAFAGVSPPGLLGA